MTGALRVVEAGVATSVQDGGRRGWAAVGVSRSGALDRELAAQLNRLVGNDPEEAVLETAGGLTVAAHGALTVAASPGAGVHELADGATLPVRPQAGEMWGYLAVRGGIHTAVELGSRSRDSRSGLGAAAIEAGVVLDVADRVAGPVTTDFGVVPRRATRVRVWPGPRSDWFGERGWEALVGPDWTVTPEVSRVGVRLSGPPLRRVVIDDLPSEGLVLGSVQVPPDGQPVVMLADHPTTGGYPVVAVVDPADLATVAQTPPGRSLRFRPP